MYDHSPRLLAAILGTAMCVGASDATPDSSLGTWNLNVAKSTYQPGPAPKSQSRTYERTADGIQETVRTVSAGGEITTVMLPAIYDGKDYPIAGSSQYDTVAMKRVDPNTTEVILKHADKVIATARRVIEGEKMTITVKSREEKGRVDITAVYEKGKESPTLISK
jgi:hypothetical protein